MLLTLLQQNLAPTSGATLYAVIYADGQPTPTGPQIVAGYSPTAVWAGNTPAPVSTQTFDWPTAATGLTFATAYRIAFVWFNGTAYSNVAESDAFTTRGSRTSGALVGGGAVVAGAANHSTLHAATGALTAGGATINGDAARVGAAVTHDTFGALLGDGAIIVGVAFGPFVPPGDQVLSIPRFGLRVKTGELFALVLDAGNVPIAYRRSNGGMVSIRLINTTTRSAAINDQGDIIQII